MNIEKKKILGISLLIILVSIFMYQWLGIKDTEEIIFNRITEGKNQIVFDSIKNTDIILCDWNIFKPEVAYIKFTKRPDSGKERLSIGFYDFQKKNLVFGDWNFKYTGGTTIKNTTFSQLLKMVKEDCKQFKENGKQDKTTWVYMEYDAERERERKEEAEIEKREALERIKNQKPITDKEIRKSKEEWERINKELEEELLKE